MRSLSDTVATLEERRSALTRELSTIDARLEAISKALAGQALVQTPGAIDRAKTPAGRSRSANAGGGTATAKRVWFEKNEIGKLLRKAAKQPTPVADVVRALAKMKGYVESLSPNEMRRFQGAAFMAVAQGVKSKILKRRSDGTVVAA
jgi:hypothetical protein